VSDWRLVTQENLEAFAQVTGEERFVHVDVECCSSATA
jgi:acyl dehydratase